MYLKKMREMHMVVKGKVFDELSKSTLLAFLVKQSIVRKHICTNKTKLIHIHYLSVQKFFCYILCISFTPTLSPEKYNNKNLSFA